MHWDPPKRSSIARWDPTCIAEQSVELRQPFHVLRSNRSVLIVDQELVDALRTQASVQRLLDVVDVPAHLDACNDMFPMESKTLPHAPPPGPLNWNDRIGIEDLLPHASKVTTLHGLTDGTPVAIQIALSNEKALHVFVR